MSTIEALHRYALHESPTGDRRLLDALAEVLEADAAAAGFGTAREPHPTGDHLVWTLPATGDDGAPVLLLSHYDTVWPAGTTRLISRSTGWCPNSTHTPCSSISPAEDSAGWDLFIAIGLN